MSARIVSLRLALRRNTPYLVLIALVYLLYGQFHGNAGSYPFFVSLLGVAGLWLVIQGNNDRADHHAIQRAIDGVAPQPGRWTAVIGNAIAGEPETASQGSDVLAYRYQVIDEERGVSTSEGRRPRYLSVRLEGYFLAPTAIQTASGTVRLAGFPDLIHLDKKPLPAGILDRAETRARQSPRFFPAFLLRDGIVASAADRIDIDILHQASQSTGDSTCKSWVLRSGDKVCVFGKWRDGALVPSLTRPRGLPVYGGAAEQAEERLQADSHAFRVVGAVILLAAVALAGWSMM